MRKTSVFVSIAAVGLASSFAAAQTGGPYDLSWNTIDGGGVTFATGGAYSLGGTIGQFDASTPMAGGNFTLTGGFWPGAVTTVGPCNVADFATPYGVLDFFDVQAFLGAFAAHDQSADLIDDDMWDFFDVQTFLSAFSAGCP